MKNATPWYLVCAVVFVLISCQKEKSIDTLGQSGSTTGSWTFLYMQASTVSTVDVINGTDDSRTVTFSNYITQNNTGTVNFSGTKMSYTGLSYTVDTTAFTYFYDNGVLNDSMEFPFTVSIPATSGSVSYQKISSDSLYFTSGAITGAGGSVSTQPAGYKLKFFGDTMTMTTTVDNVQLTLSPGGGSQKTISHAQVVTTLKKL